MRTHLHRITIALLCLVANYTAAERPKQEVISPGDKVIKLFNGNDLTGLYTWLKGDGRNDPHRAFTVHDGMIHVSGEGRGYVATEKTYRDYRSQDNLYRLGGKFMKFVGLERGGKR